MLDEDKVTQPNILIHASDHKRETKRVISWVWGYDAFIKEIDLVEYIGPQMMKLIKCLFADAEIWTGVKSDGSDRLRYSIVWAWQPAQTKQSWATTRHVASLSRGRGIINNLNMNMNTLWAGSTWIRRLKNKFNQGLIVVADNKGELRCHKWSYIFYLCISRWTEQGDERWGWVRSPTLLSVTSCKHWSELMTNDRARDDPMPCDPPS